MENEDNIKAEYVLIKGNEFFSNGSYSEAFDLYFAFLSDKLAKLNSSDTLVQSLNIYEIIIIDQLVDLSVLFGEFEGAEHLMISLIELNEEAGNIDGKHYSFLKYVELLLSQGDTLKAYENLKSEKDLVGEIEQIEFSENGLKKWESETLMSLNPTNSAFIFSRLYLLMGRTLTSLGKYNASLAAFDMGLFHVNKGTEDIVTQAKLPLQLFMAGTLLEMGFLENADELLDMIHEDLDFATGPGYYVLYLELSGKLNLLNGNYGSALENLRSVVNLTQAYSFSISTMLAQLNLAHIYILVNQTVEAEEIVAELIDQAKRLENHQILQRANFLQELIQARMLSFPGKLNITPSVIELWKPNTEIHKKEINLGTKGLSDLEPSNNFLAFFEDRLLGFNWLLAQGSFDQAKIQFNEINEVFQPVDSIIINLQLSFGKGMIAYYDENYDQAEQIFSSILQPIRQIGLRPLLWQLLRFLSWTWVKLDRKTEEIAIIQEDADRILNEITNSLEGIERSIFQINKWTAEEEYLVASINQLIQKRASIKWWNPVSVINYRLQLNLVLDHIHRFKSNESFGEESNPLPKYLPKLFSSLKKLQNRSRRTLQIGFLVLPDRTFVYSQIGFSVRFGISRLTRTQIRSLISKWHKGFLSESGRRLRAEDFRGIVRDEISSAAELLTFQFEISKFLAEELYIIELLELYKKADSITFLPDDSLHGFPFAVLRLKETYLVEKYPVSIAFEKPKLKSDAHKIKGKSKTDKYLIVSIPNGNKNFPPLPGTLSETENIERWLSENKLVSERYILDQNAKKAKQDILALLPSCRFFHIASHGIFFPNDPAKSGLVFIDQKGEMEVLSISDLENVDLTNVFQLSLAACWSADSFIAPGKEIISLPETICRSGASHVLGALWPIKDEFAVLFYNQYYRYLENNSPESSLQKTQIDCIHNRLPGYPANKALYVKDWASFNIYSNEKISLNKARLFVA